MGNAKIFHMSQILILCCASADLGRILALLVQSDLSSSLETMQPKIPSKKLQSVHLLNWRVVSVEKVCAIERC